MYTGVHPKGHLFWLIQLTCDLPLSKIPALIRSSILYILLAAEEQGAAAVYTSYANQLNHVKSEHDVGTQPVVLGNAHCSAGQDG